VKVRINKRRRRRKHERFSHSRGPGAKSGPFLFRVPINGLFLIHELL
jgi:hypothetical protein